MKNFFRTKRKMILAMAALMVIYTIGHLIKAHHNANASSQESVIVEVAKVKQGKISLEEHTVGALVAEKNVELAPEVSGQVEQILAHDGAFVTKGTPIIQLDDAVNRAKAESAKANLVYSENNYNRMQLLIKKGAISLQAVDQALADLKEKRAIEKEIRVLAEKMLIVAPFDGVLGKVKVSPGEYVTVGQPLVSLTDISNLRVEFNVSEKYLAKIKLGQQVTLTSSSYPGKQFYGKISFISPTVNTQDRTLSVYADVPNQDRLLTAGLFVNVLHLMGEENNALMIPAESLIATIDGQEVFKVVDGKAKSTTIKIGQRTVSEVQILEGLTLGDKVVTSGQQKLKDGVVVKVL